MTVSHDESTVSSTFPSAPESAGERLRSVLLHAPIVILAIDQSGRVTSLEGRPTEMENLGVGGLLDPSIAQSVFDLCRRMPTLATAYQRALSGEESLVALAHGTRHYDARIEPLRDGAGAVTGAIGVIIDVTEHHEAIAALEQSAYRLAQAERVSALGSLAGGIAHQINNALTHMRLSLGRLVTLELGRRPVTPLRLHRIELLQDVREGMDKVEHVVKELRNFSSVEDSPVEAVNVPALLNSVLGLVSHEIKHRAHLTCEFGDVPLAKANERGLQQVFLNLLLHASQSIPEGGANLHEIIVKTQRDPQGRAVVEVTDTGRGMSPELLKHIFEPTPATQPVGPDFVRGLGLAVCHDIVTAAGGEIMAEFIPQRGTTFRVVLPASEPTAASTANVTIATGSQPIAILPPPPAVARSRILIIDDDRPVAAALALEFDGHDVVVAGSGREALQILRDDIHFDVVFCDLMMPEVTGMDLYDVLEPTAPGLVKRFVFMTGGAFTPRAERFLARVSNRRIYKPFRSEVLQAIVQRMTWEAQCATTAAQAAESSPVEASQVQPESSGGDRDNLGGEKTR